jgi:hypothetical protein
LAIEIYKWLGQDVFTGVFKDLKPVQVRLFCQSDIKILGQGNDGRVCWHIGKASTATLSSLSTKCHSN